MTRMVRNTLLSFTVAGLLALTGCGQGGDQGDAQDTTAVDTTQQQQSATVQIKGLQDSTITGTVTLTADAMGGLSLSGQISGLTPGQHGMHVHDGASCESPGTHLNPTGAQHGAPDSTAHHIGDLGNIEAGQDSTASLQVMVSGVTLDQVLNKPLIIHSGPDDFKTQPSGNSGTPVACGMIQQEGAMMGMTPGATTDTAHTGGH